jgi:pyruvate dehydrogenase E2 component (dihydrolipoamide acetyltransferase)
MRRAIAHRLTESTCTIPHFHLTIDCQVDGLIALREQLNHQVSAGRKHSINDFIIRAVALALRKVPAVNSSWLKDEARIYDDIDIAVAVATPGGLITPVIRQADRKTLSDISQEMADLAARARLKKLKPAEFDNGSFSITNLGMYGITSFAAIINPPQAAILAIGALEKRAIVGNDGLAVAAVMTCTLSCDHRLIDGALGAEFLRTFKGLIEHPASAIA